MNAMSQLQRLLMTGAVVFVAVAIVLFKYWDYVTNPWTRNGQAGRTPDLGTDHPSAD